MKRRWRKLTALLMTGIMSAFLLAGCGSGKGGTDQAEKQSTENAESSGKAESAAEENEEKGELEACTLNYVSWIGNDVDQAILDGFMAENPQVKVVNRTLDGNTYATLLTPMLLNGDTPDVFMVNAALVSSLMKEGYLLPITDTEAVARQKESMPAVNQALSYNGETYAYTLANSVGSGIVYYNKKYFEANQLEIPETQEAFESLCQQILELGDTPLAVPAAATWLAWYPAQNQFIQTIADLGEFGDTYEAEIKLLKGEIKVSDLYRSTFYKIKEYVDNGWVSEAALGLDYIGGAQFLVDGGAAMTVSLSGFTSYDVITEYEGDDFELGAFPLPGIPDHNGVCHVSSSPDRILVISSDTKNPEAAKALFDYFTREDVLLAYLNNQSLFNSGLDVKVDPVLEYTFDILNDTSKYTQNLASMMYLPAGWKTNFAQYSADIYSGADVDELLKKLDADFETAISSVDVQEYLDQLEN